MQSFGWYVRRVRSMGPREIVWRIRSLLRDYGDVLRCRANWLPRLDSKQLPQLAHFGPGFRFDSHAGIGSPLTLPDPAWGRRLAAKADAILEDRLSYFDLDDQFLGRPIGWHSDLSAGKTGPLRHRTFVDYRDFATYGDCKLVWEPNRHHQLVVLARRYRVSGDERYARKVIALIRDWCEANPFGYGMNWKSPMEVAIRNINWIFALDLLLGAEALDQPAFDEILRTIHLGTWDTVRRLSQGSSSNNHLIGEAAGVFIVAAWFPAFPESRRWLERSQAILEEEILRQTYADGCTREHAFGYMHFVTQFELLCLLAGRRSGHEFSAGFGERLQRMYTFLAELCADTGALPAVGDADDGYVVDLGELPRDAAALVTVGGELFDDDSLRLAAGAETAWWLLGRVPGPVTPARRQHSAAFRDAGYFLLRSGAARDNEMSVLFDCAELGFGAIAAHGHADCLSFVLSVGGVDFIVDAGTYDYFTHPAWRNYFRSTRAHNTVVVDGADQSEMTGPFMWGSRANATLLGWQDDPGHARVSGQHDGYGRLADPVIHRRELHLDKPALSLEVIDDILCAAEHAVSRRFHLATECRVERQAPSTVRVSRDGRQLLVEAPGAQIDIVAAVDDGFEGWVSDGYHRRAASHCLRIAGRAGANEQLRTILRVV